MRTRQWVAGVIAFLVSFAVGGGLVVFREASEASDAKMVAGQQADAYANQLAARLSPLDSAAQAVRADVLANGGTTDPFALQRYLDVLHSSLGGGWLIATAPGNRVNAIVPREGNESVVGLYYPTSKEQWPSVRQAMRAHKSVLVGPVSLEQGGIAFIYRTPVYLNDGSYWGVISTATDATSLLVPPPGTSASQNDDMAVGVRTSTGDVVVGDPLAFDGSYATATRSMLGETWEVGVTVAPQRLALRTGRVIVVLVASLALGLLSFLLAGARRRERELTRLMNDVSTQAPGVLFQLRTRSDGRRYLSYASPALASILGVTPVEGKYDQDQLKDLVNADDIPAILAALTQSVTTGQPWRQRFRVTTTDGIEKWLFVSASPDTLPTGEVQWHGWASDATQDLADEAALRVSASLFDVTRDAVAILDIEGVVTFTNPGFATVTGFPTDQTVGLPFQTLLADATPESVLGDLWTQLNRHGYWSGELSIRGTDGSVRTDGAVANAVSDADGNISHFVVVLDNMNLTRDDPVTGLPHTRTLEESLRVVRELEPSSAGVAYVVLGLDGFRAVNDAYGHRVGDRLLSDVGTRLRHVLPVAVPLVRLRGDEFAFYVHGAGEVEEVEITVERCLAALVPPFDISGLLIRTSAAAGIAVTTDQMTDITELQLHANQAMRAAKRSGANQLRFFRSAMQDEAREQALLRHEVDTALDLGQFHVEFQPIVDLHTREVHRAEALIRWKHPTRGDIPPDVFISIAEQSGRIGDVDDIVFAAAIDALTTLRLADPGFQVSVNLSPVELREPGPRHSERTRLVRQADLPGSALIAEVTEGVLLTSDDVVDANLAEYRSAGLQFAIDDFGTGYSSLSYLQRLDVQYLKIDRSFIDELAPGSAGLALCQAIIVMADKLGLGVVAEGVETAEQNLLLTQAGCDFAQGFLHARPMSIERLIGWLADRR